MPLIDDVNTWITSEITKTRKEQDWILALASQLGYKRIQVISSNSSVGLIRFLEINTEWEFISYLPEWGFVPTVTMVIGRY